MNAKFTPGPWVHLPHYIRDGADLSNVIAVVGNPEAHLGILNERTAEMLVANGNLIAAAPDGYDAAKLFLDHDAQDHTDVTYEEVYAAMKAFVEKVEGV